MTDRGRTIDRGVQRGWCGSRPIEGRLVFSSDNMGTRPWSPNFVTKRFIRVRRAAGLSHFRASRSPSFHGHPDARCRRPHLDPGSALVPGGPRRSTSMPMPYPAGTGSPPRHCGERSKRRTQSPTAIRGEQGQLKEQRDIAPTPVPDRPSSLCCSSESREAWSAHCRRAQGAVMCHRGHPLPPIETFHFAPVDRWFGSEPQ